MNFTPSLQSCIPYQCGFDPFNLANIYACSAAGYGGVLSCDSPECRQWCPNANAAPAVAVAAKSIGFPSKLTPQNLVRPIPDITEALRSIPVAEATGWCGLNQSIADNPLIAVGILAGAFLLISKRRGR